MLYYVSTLPPVTGLTAAQPEPNSKCCAIITSCFLQRYLHHNMQDVFMVTTTIFRDSLAHGRHARAWASARTTCSDSCTFYAVTRTSWAKSSKLFCSQQYTSLSSRFNLVNLGKIRRPLSSREIFLSSDRIFTSFNLSISDACMRE